MDETRAISEKAPKGTTAEPRIECVRMKSSASLRERLDALGPAPRAELLHVLMLPDFDRADAIGSYWGNAKTRHLRGAADRLRGGSRPPGGARRMLAEGES